MNEGSKLEGEIERYLLNDRGWVPDGVLASEFGVRERRFRQLGHEKGLCSDFAISSDAGLKHVGVASTAEYLRFKHRIRRHAIGELRRLRALDRRRNQVTILQKAFESEKDSGQGLLFSPAAAS